MARMSNITMGFLKGKIMQHVGKIFYTKATVSLPPTCPSLVCNVVTFHSRTSVSTPLVTNPYGDMSHTICDDNYPNVSTLFYNHRSKILCPKL